MARWTAILVGVSAALVACARPAPPADSPGRATAATPATFAVPWLAADALFHRDPRWLGGDGAYSVDLGNARTLWLFGDSFIDEGPVPRRDRATMVRNSIGIQAGSDPTTAGFHAYYGHQGDRPAAFFAGEGDQWLWPGASCRVGQRLLIFLLEVRRTKGKQGPFSFRVVGSQARLVENPSDAPDRWRTRRVPVPTNPWGVLLGTGAALPHRDHVYLFSVVEPGNHDVYLVRWSKGQAEAGELDGPEWWDGGSWVAQKRLAARPGPVFHAGQTELSVHHDTRSKTFLAVQTVGFGRAHIATRSAPSPAGPWTQPRRAFEPVEGRRPGAFVYAAKAHPHLGRGAALPVTYMVNHGDLKVLVNNNTIYYPRFIRLHRESPSNPTRNR